MKTTFKVYAVICVLLLSLCLLSSCGKGGSIQKQLVGVWEATNTESSKTYGASLEFTKDGKLKMGVDLSALSDATGVDLSSKELNQTLDIIGSLYEVEYKIINDHTIEVKTKAFFGLATEKHEVEFSLDGDMLRFDDGIYKRSK